jgi:hypothetical protein
MKENELYLSSEEGGVLTEQITRLLRDEETDNCALLLELMAGGGVNRRLLGYLFGIGVSHRQEPVQARAMELLRRYGSAETIRQAERLKGSLPYHFNESEYLGKYSNPDFDLFDFLLAYKMCNWHATPARHGRYIMAHQTLNLSHYPEKTLSPALETLNFIRYIILPAHKDFDLESAVPQLLQLPLESVFIENIRLLRFPSKLFSLPGLKTLSIKRGAYRPRYPVQVPDEGPFGSDTLETLFVEGYILVDTDRLGPFPKLRDATLLRCSLTNLDFLRHSDLLRAINVKHNHLHELPPFLSGFTELRRLELSNNPFHKIELDLSRLTKLEELDLRMKAGG